MSASSSSSTRTFGLPLLLALLALAVLVAGEPGSASLEDQSKELAASKYLATVPPNNLVRLLFYGPRERLTGYKRSSSALDPLAGITLGKRSYSPVEYLNMEPMYGRYHPGANMYHLRWAPVSGYEGLEDL